MSFELYEVWATDDSGHDELINTTKSRTHAILIAQNSLNEGYVSATVYQEDEDTGDLVEIKTLEPS